MVWIIITIFGAAGVANLMRLAQARDRDIWWVGTVNYLLAAGFHLAFWAIELRCPLLTREALLGVCAGLGYGAAYFLMNAAIKCAGVGISSAASRLSLVVPVAASILIWHEELSCLRGVGLLLVLISLAMLYRGKAVPTEVRPRNRFLVLFGLFLVMGLARCCMKAMAEGAPEGGKVVFLFFMFAASGMPVLGYALWKSKKPRVDEIVHGAVLGGVNGLAIFSLTSALQALDAVVVFPTVSVGTILVSAWAGFALWKERFPRIALLGMAIGAAALVLVNL